MKDSFTIAFPVYNRTDYIRKALDSAVNQTVKCKILLVDNNSPHNEFKKIVDSYNNPLIKYFKTKETVPQDENFNNCIRYVDTPWMTILHDDDMLHCQYVELAARLIEKFGDIGGFAVKCDVGEKEWDGINQKVAVTDHIYHVREPFFYFAILSPFPGVAFKRDIGIKLNGFNVDLHPIADNDFWYRLSMATKILLVDQKYAYFRISPAQSTNKLIDAMINNIYEYRLNLIKKGKYNNFLTLLALEESRINNLEYFKKTYKNIEIPKIKLNEKRLRRAEKILKIWGMTRIVLKYRKIISYTRVKS